MPKPVLVLLIIICFPLLLPAQQSPDAAAWDRIDSLLYRGKNVEDLRTQLLQWKEQAQKDNDVVTLARCYHTLIRIADGKFADTLFFRNSLSLDSIIKDQSTAPLLKSMAHLLKAQRIEEYTATYYYNARRSLIAGYDSTIEYASLNRNQLDSIVHQHLQAALQFCNQAPTVKGSHLWWLSSVEDLLWNGATLRDIIYAELIQLRAHAVKKQSDSFANAWLALPPGQLAALPALPQYEDVHNQLLALYKEWMQVHQNNNPDAFYYIESLARKFFYEKLEADSFQQQLYENYLQQCLQLSYGTVKAHAVFQLCIGWYEKGAKYNPGARQSMSWQMTPDIAPIDTSLSRYYARALNLLQAHRSLVDSVPGLSWRLKFLENEILKSYLVIKMPDTQLPGNPVYAMLHFRNVQQLHMRMVRLSPYAEWDSRQDTNVKKLMHLPAVQEVVHTLPSYTDYQLHNALIQIDPLPAGKYAILFADSAISPENKKVNCEVITVSNIAVINNGRHVFVLDRKTGAPLSGAVVQCGYRTFRSADTIWLKGARKADATGKVVVDDRTEMLQVVFNGDSIRYDMEQRRPYWSDDYYSKDEYDNLLDFCETTTQLHLFTDRAIYRPGQTVHYKGIFLVKHPRTGEYLVLNWKNLKFPFYTKWIYRLARKFSGRKIEMELTDPFGRVMDSLFILPNQYGSFSGSFVIPPDAATGEWSFDCWDVDISYQNRGAFRVEEYKRPSFEAILHKPEKDIAVGDSFSVKAVVRSFAGAPLQEVQVEYEIAVRYYLPSGKTGFKKDTTITGKGYTNEKGELAIPVPRTLPDTLAVTDDEVWKISYYIDITAIDATGESHEDEISFTVSSRPVELEIKMPKVMERNALKPVYILPQSSFARVVQQPVRVRIYQRYPAVHHTPDDMLWAEPDTWLYNREEFLRRFPDIQFASGERRDAVGTAILYETTMAAPGEKLLLPSQLLGAGHYLLEAEAIENGKVTGLAKQHFTIYDVGTSQLPAGDHTFNHLEYVAAEPGQKIKWITGVQDDKIFSIYHVAWYEKGGNGFSEKQHYRVYEELKGYNHWEFTIPQKAVGQMVFTHLYVINNRLYRYEEKLWITGKARPAPEIIVEQYRTRLHPGAPETFTVSVKTRNVHTAAELMTTLYDATLDQLEKHTWSIPAASQSLYASADWPQRITHMSTSYSPYLGRVVELELPGEWLHPALYGYNQTQRGAASTDYTQYGFDPARAAMLHGRAAGLSASPHFEEVIVTGYSTVKKNATASVATISEGTGTSLAALKGMLVILDGLPYSGDISTIDAASITQGIILKGADATSMYGSRAANGVVLLSTKGPLELPDITRHTTAPAIRRNFAETAFFYPRLFAGRDGFYTIQFTLPESVTSWKWKLLAHTKKGDFAYAERRLVSQLPLMVQPDMPRFLYQGDQLVLKSRITNLDTVAYTGTLTCSIEDVVTGEDLTERWLKENNTPFTIQKLSAGTGTFVLQVPVDVLHPVKIKIAARTGHFGDGEEHLIPILSKKVLATQHIPVVVNGKEIKEINTPTLPESAEPYGIAVHIAPQPQSAMVQALPHLAWYPYNCAEQTFNKLLAYGVALKLLRTEKGLQQQLVKNDSAQPKLNAGELPEELSNRTMPWLQLSVRNLLQQQKLAKLMDSFYVKRKMEQHLEELKQLQQRDGGISWYNEGSSNRYISEYILGGFGKWMNDQLPPDDKNQQKLVQEMIKKLVNYCDREFEKDYLSAGVASTIHYLYNRSAWLKQYPYNKPGLSVDSLLQALQQNSVQLGAGLRAMLITAALRWSTPNSSTHQYALEELESLRQSAIRDSISGMRWKVLEDADDLALHTEEWLVKLAEAFEQGKDNATVNGIITWLLQCRKEHSWSSTKSTADMVSLLHRRNGSMVQSLQLTAQVNGATLELTNNMLEGQQAAFLRTNAFPQFITAATDSHAVKVVGGVKYYYFVDGDALPAGTVQLTRKLYRYNNERATWEPVQDQASLTMAEKLRVVLTIHTPRPLQYVLIDEKRAAACEPLDVASGYEYGNGLGYYKSIRDNGMLFFAAKVPAGTSEISYECKIAKAGTFNWGPASLSCMYKPELSGYSNSFSITIPEQQ